MFFEARPPQHSFVDFFMSLLYIFHILAYLGYAHWLLKKRETETNLPYKLRILRFVRRGIAGYAGFLLIQLATFFLVFITEIPGAQAELLLVLVLAVSLHAISYFAITETGIFATTQPAVNGEKYQTSPLTPEMLRDLANRLIDLMQQEKPFLDVNLKISHIAERLKISPHHVSQILNQSLGAGFYDFVNEYRIDEAKCRLRDESYSHYKIQAIAQDVGFKNKASFNRIFKNSTGQTPSEYRNEHLTPIK